MFRHGHATGPRSAATRCLPRCLGFCLARLSRCGGIRAIYKGVEHVVAEQQRHGVAAKRRSRVRAAVLGAASDAQHRGSGRGAGGVRQNAFY